MTKMFTYHCCGLVLATPFQCPTLEEISTDIEPDVTVVEGHVPNHLDSTAGKGSYWEVEPRRYLFRGGQWAGSFLVEDGKNITFQRSPETEDEMVAFCFLSSVLAALLRQRGLLVLHANAAALANKGVAVSGLSGAGKSTTLAALLARGCAMLADDITVLKIDESGCVLVLPGIPQMHLTEDAAARLGEDISELPRYQWRRMKAAVPTYQKMAPMPAPLQALYLLIPTNRDELHCQVLNGTDKFIAVKECMYGPMLAAENPALFPLFAALIAQVEIYQVERPLGRWTADEMAELILANLN